MRMSNAAARHDRIADLADVVLNLSREIRSQDTEKDAIPLTVTEGNVMRFIDRHPGATPTELAHGTGLQRTNMSAALRALETKGLVERIQDPGDGRTVRVMPTERAAENLTALRANWSALLGDVLEDTTDEQIQSAVSLLTELEDGLVRARRSRRTPPEER